MSEQMLVRRLRARDQFAQAELFRRLRGWLWTQAFRIVRNKALADEVLHDAWIDAVVGIDSFQGRSRFRTWIAAIVMNKARSQCRQEFRFLPSSALGMTDLERMEGRHEHTPEAHLLEREAAGRVERALAKLSQQQRSVIVMRDFQGASAAEVCHRLEITDEAQRVRLCRARASIRRVLEDDGRRCA